MNFNKRKIIAIIGLMGVGKTTIGFKLASKLKYYFIDSDQEIEDKEKQTIPEIFASKGEKYFRELECKIIREIVARDEDIVLSLGGGAFMNEEVRKILQEKAVTVWLVADIETILHRIGNKSGRPLLNNGNKREILRDLAKKRYPIYAKSDLKFTTDDENHDAIIAKIINEINKLKNDK